MAIVDVYAVTDKLDDTLLQVLATRLEARSHHLRFQAMLTEYLDAMNIDAARTIVDLGCGAGVAARAIARRKGFTGRVTGIDLSAGLVHVAERTALKKIKTFAVIDALLEGSAGLPRQGILFHELDKVLQELQETFKTDQKTLEKYRPEIEKAAKAFEEISRQNSKKATERIWSDNNEQEVKRAKRKKSIASRLAARRPDSPEVDFSFLQADQFLMGRLMNQRNNFRH